MKMIFCHHFHRQCLRRALFNQGYSRRPAVRREASIAQEAFPSPVPESWHSRISTKSTTTPQRHSGGTLSRKMMKVSTTTTTTTKSLTTPRIQCWWGLCPSWWLNVKTSRRRRLQSPRSKNLWESWTRRKRLDHVHVIVLCVWWCVFSAKLHLQDESVSPVSSTPEQCSSRTSSAAALASRETRPIWWSLRCQEEWRRQCRMLQVRNESCIPWKYC